jgi:predicted RecB family nuclease
VKGIISKSDWLAAAECLKKAWLGLRTETSVAPSEAELFRMEQGQSIGKLARDLYPKGIFVSQRGGKGAAEITQELVADLSIETLFEATFNGAPFVARADIMTRQNGAWHVLEVKSSFSDTSRLVDLVDDLAYTVFVLKRAGQRIAKASLVVLARSFRFGDSSDQLFQTIDKTEEVEICIAKYEDKADAIGRALFDTASPKPLLVSSCRSCDFFHEQCLGFGIARTVLEIPGLHYKKLKKLSETGIVNLASVTEDLGLNERQLRAKLGALSGTLIVEPGLRAELASIDWPCHYLDFETVATVLPLYEGHGCHRQVLTQFSIHHHSDINSEPTHNEYLADAMKDCEGELAEALIEALGDTGSIVVYSDFEKTRIKALQTTFPDYAERLEAILRRLKNFLPLIESHVYHPDFQGSFSIKKVLPALVPELSYEGLEVADGDTAITRFARMARGEISDSQIPSVRQQLLDYCKMDTLAMLRLHQALHRLAGNAIVEKG